MTSKTEGGTTLNFGYNAEHIHAVGTHAGQTNTYDKNGNSYDVGSDFHSYDVENRLSQISMSVSPLQSHELSL